MLLRPSLERTPWWVVLAFLLPSFIGFSIFVMAPGIINLGISITNFSGGPNWRFLGLKNFSMLLQSTGFLNSLKVTFYFVIGTVALQISLGIAFASLLHSGVLLQKFFKALFFLPNVLSAVGVSLAFAFIYDPQYGLANEILSVLQLPELGWLTDQRTALFSLILMTLWMSFGYYMIIFISGLSAINPVLYEAAIIDGSSRLQTFVRITLPLLSPTMFFALTMSVIGSFKVFAQVFMMTGGQQGGGPAGSTNVMVFDIYRNSFVYYKFGYASAESVVLLAIILVITLFQFRNQKRWVSYDL